MDKHPKRKNGKRGHDEPDTGLTRKPLTAIKFKRKDNELSKDHKEDGDARIEIEIKPEHNQSLEHRRTDDVIDEDKQSDRKSKSKDDGDGPTENGK